MTATQKVIIAVDDSQHSERALTYYLQHLHRAGNEVVLVHCVELPVIPHSAHGELLQDMFDSSKMRAKEVERKYLDMLKQVEAGSVLVISNFHSHPGQFICESAHKEKGGMIVMGTRGLGTIRRTILGSVSDYVVHHAHCPVVICRK